MTGADFRMFDCVPSSEITDGIVELNHVKLFVSYASYSPSTLFHTRSPALAFARTSFRIRG